MKLLSGRALDSVPSRVGAGGTGTVVCSAFQFAQKCQVPLRGRQGPELTCLGRPLAVTSGIVSPLAHLTEILLKSTPQDLLASSSPAPRPCTQLHTTSTSCQRGLHMHLVTVVLPRTPGTLTAKCTALHNLALASSPAHAPLRWLPRPPGSCSTRFRGTHVTMFLFLPKIPAGVRCYFSKQKCTQTPGTFSFRPPTIKPRPPPTQEDSLSVELGCLQVSRAGITLLMSLGARPLPPPSQI